MNMKLNYKRTMIVGFAFMSISAFWQVYDNVIPLILKNTFGLAEGTTGLVMGIDNVLALFMLPVFGALSDKTRTKLGRRTPYILFGTAAAVIAMMLLPVFDQKVMFWPFMSALFVVLIAMAVYRSPAVAYMPDITPKPLRSKANGVINLMGALGSVVILGITGFLVADVENPSYMPLFVFLAVFMVVAVLVLLLTINENKAVAEMRAQSAAMGIDEGSVEDEAGKGEKMEPAVRKSFWLILASIFLWFMGYNAIISAFTRYAEDMWSMSVGSSSLVLLVANVAAILFFIPVGFIATKVGRKKTILIGISMLAVGFGTAFFYTGFSNLLFVNFVLAGVGWAFINVNSLPMVVDMSKGADVGKYTGYYYFASMSAQIITPWLSGTLVDKTAWGWQILFPYSCFFVILSFITMSFVKHGDTRPSLPADKLEAFGADD